jgi:RNA polymerase sigma factor (sigma-70 family)
VGGETQAWHHFIDKYTALLHSVLRRYLFDEEEIRSVYVLLLDRLYKQKLATYEGRSALSTWLVLVTRNVAADHIRKTKGRLVPSRSLEKLPAQDQRVFQLFFAEDMTLGDVLERLHAEGHTGATSESIAESVERIRARVDPRVFRRLAYRKRAESLGLASSRLLEYLDRVRQDQEARALKENPEFLLMEREARRRAREVLALTGRLTDEEQQLLTLRYHRGFTANEIASSMDWPNPRLVYRKLDRCIRKLREWVTVLRLDL